MIDSQGLVAVLVYIIRLEQWPSPSWLLQRVIAYSYRSKVLSVCVRAFIHLSRPIGTEEYR